MEPTPDELRPQTSLDRCAIAAAVAFVAVLTGAALVKLATAPFPFRGGDEQGHFSYLVHLARTKAWWPDLSGMPIYDLSGAATATLNFINHPPTFYLAAEPAFALVAALGLDPSWLRAVTLPFALAAFATIAALLARMRFGPLTIATLIWPMLFLLVPNSAAYFNNDQVALLGGALAVYGAARRIGAAEDRTGLALILVGVALASVKLTALMLVGGFAALALAGGRGRRPDLVGLAALAVVGLIVSIPFAAYLVEYGSPTPDTPGQTAMLKAYVAEFGWDRVPRVGLVDYLINAPSMFAVQLGKEFWVFPLFCALCLAPFTAFGKPADAREAVVSSVVRAAMLTTLLVLCVHLAFAWRRYEVLGWLGDLYPRYYFPLLGAYALGWALALRRLGRYAAELSARALSAIRPQFSASRQG